MIWWKKSKLKFFFLGLLFPIGGLLINTVLSCLFYSFQKGESFFDNFTWRAFYEMRYFIQKGFVPRGIHAAISIAAIAVLLLLLGPLLNPKNSDENSGENSKENDNS